MAQRPGDGLSLAQKARLWIAKKALGKSYSLTDPALGQLLGTGTTYSGKNIDETTAMQSAVVWACVRILSETIGSLPWGVFARDKGGNATPLDDHPLADVLVRSPNGDMTSTEFREALVVNLALQGNAYALKETTSARVTSLYPVLSQHVIPKRRDDGTIYYRLFDRGRWADYPREKIWHVKGFGSDGLVGYSPIGYVRQAMGVALAAEEFQARFFKQGARPSMVLTMPDGQYLPDNQRQPTRDQLQKMVAGMDNAHTAVLFEGGIKPTPVTMPLEDAQFLELRGFSVQEICRIYRIPPHMVADLERSTNNNIEHQGLEFVMFTLQPYLTRIEDSALKWLFQPGDRRTNFLRFNVEGLLRADAAARAELYASLLQNGAINRNEVRAREKLNRVDGLDDYTVQSNMVPVTKLAAMVDAQIEKSKQPAVPAQAASPPAKSGDVSVDVSLPESMQHVMSHEVKGITDLALEAKRANDIAASIVGVQRGLVADLASSQEEIKALLRRDRVAIFEDDGRTVRSRLDLN